MQKTRAKNSHAWAPLSLLSQSRPRIRPLYSKRETLIFYALVSLDLSRETKEEWPLLTVENEGEWGPKEYK